MRRGGHRRRVRRDAGAPRGAVAVVTGGASGLGRAIALRFADEGARVVVGDVRDATRAKAASRRRAARRPRRLPRRGCSRWDDVDRLVSTAVERYGRLDVMVCNAGIAGPLVEGPARDDARTDWDAIMAVNLRGVFLGSKRAVAEMVEQEPVERGARPRRHHLVAARHDRPAGPRRLRREQGRRRQPRRTRSRSTSARAACSSTPLRPGKILTGNPEGMRPELLEYSHARTPFHRLGRPADVAGGRALPRLRRRGLRERHESARRRRLDGVLMSRRCRRSFVVGNPPPHFGGRYFVFVKLVDRRGDRGHGGGLRGDVRARTRSRG